MMKIKDSHKEYMAIALKEAARAAERGGDVPIGAVITRNNEVIAQSGNQKEAQQDPSAHAEVLAIREACQKLGTWNLKDCQIYTTIEPCLMCTGAILLARIPLVVFGAREPKFGALVSNLALGKKENNPYNHSVEVVEEVMENEAAELMRSFFKDKR